MDATSHNTEDEADFNLESLASEEAGFEAASLTAGDRVRLLITMLVPLSLSVWYLLDNSWPFWDGASHVLDSIKYMDLFRHPHLMDANWWLSLLKVNYAYPPQVHAFYGLGKMMLGPGLLTEQISAVLFSGLLAFSVFSIAFEIFKSRSAAFLSVCVLQSYPLVCRLSHTTYLDFAYLSFYALAMYAIFSFSKEPGWRKCLGLGCAIGLAASSKQVAAFFLFFPCLFLLVTFAIKKRWDSVLQLISASFIAALFLLIWLVPNFSMLQWFNDRNATHLEDTRILSNVVRNGSGYLVGLPISMSALGSILFVLALPLVLRRQVVKRLVLLFASFLGIGFLLFLSSNLPEQRYIVPVFVLTAIISAGLLTRLLRSKNKILRAVFVIVSSMMLLHWILFNFSPYPIDSKIAIFASEVFCAKGGTPSGMNQCENPTPPGDVWAQEWIVDTIDRNSNSPPGYLYIVPNDAQYNVHTLTLIARIKKSLVVPTTSRIWTLKGDQVSFDPASLEYFEWFLLHSKKPDYMEDRKISIGDRQDLPRDQDSRNAITQIEDYVAQNCALVGRKIVYDQSEILLFRRN